MDRDEKGSDLKSVRVRKTRWVGTLEQFTRSASQPRKQSYIMDEPELGGRGFVAN